MKNTPFPVWKRGVLLLYRVYSIGRPLQIMIERFIINSFYKICQSYFSVFLGGGFMFQVRGENCSSMHGAGVVDSIVSKKVNGVVREYYLLKIPVGRMLVMIPPRTAKRSACDRW